VLARAAGFTAEVTAHHLLFNSEAEGAEYKVNPPLRNEDIREALFAAFREGKISMIGSDHAPHTEEEKAEYSAAPSGISGVETTVPMMMNLFRKGMIPLEMLVNMGSRTPAQTFGIRKGKIEKGYDADLSVFDLRNVKTIDADRLHSKNPSTVYNGMEAIFPETVILRGNIQIDGGEFCGEEQGEDVVG
jgi:dihydroorotase